MKTGVCRRAGKRGDGPGHSRKGGIPTSEITTMNLYKYCPMGELICEEEIDKVLDKLRVTSSSIFTKQYLWRFSYSLEHTGRQCIKLHSCTISRYYLQ